MCLRQRSPRGLPVLRPHQTTNSELSTRPVLIGYARRTVRCRCEEGPAINSRINLPARNINFSRCTSPFEHLSKSMPEACVRPCHCLVPPGTSVQGWVRGCTARASLRKAGNFFALFCTEHVCVCVCPHRLRSNLGWSRVPRSLKVGHFLGHFRNSCEQKEDDTRQRESNIGVCQQHAVLCLAKLAQLFASMPRLPASGAVA